MPDLSELDIQCGLRKRLRHIAPAICLVAIPNGAKRGQKAINQALREGLKMGFPDLLCLSNEGHTAFIEVKRADGSPTPQQKDWHALLRRWGYPVTVIRSVDEGEAFLRRQGFPFMVEAVARHAA